MTFFDVPLVIKKTREAYNNTKHMKSLIYSSEGIHAICFVESYKNLVKSFDMFLDIRNICIFTDMHEPEVRRYAGYPFLYITYRNWNTGMLAKNVNKYYANFNRYFVYFDERSDTFQYYRVITDNITKRKYCITGLNRIYRDTTFTVNGIDEYILENYDLEYLLSSGKIVDEDMKKEVDIL